MVKYAELPNGVRIPYVEQGDTLVVLGDPALNMANLFKREVRRPLSHGIISSRRAANSVRIWAAHWR